jgi:hypothetical protein
MKKILPVTITAAYIAIPIMMMSGFTGYIHAGIVQPSPSSVRYMPDAVLQKTASLLVHEATYEPFSHLNILKGTSRTEPVQRFRTIVGRASLDQSGILGRFIRNNIRLQSVG